MTGLLEPKTDDDRVAPRPLITIGVSAAGVTTLIALAFKYGLFAAVVAAPAPTLTIQDVGRALEEHQAQMLKINEAQQRSSDRQERLLERLCIVASVNAGARPEECAR